MTQPVTEIVRIPLLAGATIEDANSPAGKIMSETLATLAQQEHYQRAYLGRQVENSSIVQLYIGMMGTYPAKSICTVERIFQIGTHLTVTRSS